VLSSLGEVSLHVKPHYATDATNHRPAMFGGDRGCAPLTHALGLVVDAFARLNVGRSKTLPWRVPADLDWAGYDS